MSDANDFRGESRGLAAMNAPRLPLPALLWVALALGYLLASASGHRALALAIVGLMIATVLAFGRRYLLAALVAASLLAISYLGADSLPFLTFLAYLPPLFAFAFMAYFFQRTLRPGADPLITRVARKEHAVLPDEIARYTRTLTQIWALCFGALFLTILLLAFWMPLASWSRWAHGLGYVVPASLFVGEYVFRHRYFRDREHHGLLRLVANILVVIRESAIASGEQKTLQSPASGDKP